jgi:hypothetical protein
MASSMLAHEKFRGESVQCPGKVTDKDVQNVGLEPTATLIPSLHEAESTFGLRARRYGRAESRPAGGTLPETPGARLFGVVDNGI